MQEMHKYYAAAQPSYICHRRRLYLHLGIVHYWNQCGSSVDEFFNISSLLRNRTILIAITDTVSMLGTDVKILAKPLWIRLDHAGTPEELDFPLRCPNVFKSMETAQTMINYEPERRTP
jgi:hypothetical protein